MSLKPSPYTLSAYLKRRFSLLLLPLSATACLEAHDNVTLTFRPPALIDASRLEITVLPFNIETLIDSLAEASGSPRPRFPELENSLSDFVGDTPTGLDTLDRDWSVLRARVSRLADSLGRLDRSEPGYNDAYGRLRSLYTDLTAREFELENRLREILSSAALQLAGLAVGGSDSLRRWEDEALRSLPEAMRAASIQSRRQPLTIRDVDFESIPTQLAPGSWWAVARLRHPENPFLEYYWNVPFTVNRLVPAVVPIGSHNMITRWRH